MSISFVVAYWFLFMYHIGFMKGSTTLDGLH